MAVNSFLELQTRSLISIRETQVGSAEELTEILTLVEKIDINLQGWASIQRQQVAEVHKGQKGTLCVPHTCGV